MRMYDLLSKKRHGLPLTDEEIAWFVRGYTDGDIPDYQASALCMAICCQGMTDEECASLTRHMMHSGDVVDLSAFPHTVDKHSTGGVADNTTLILLPICATLGMTVAKMSGRGLGHTGGTIDKLESIPGFRVDLTSDEFVSRIRTVGAALIGQTGNLAPADKKLYGLRDVTATVDSIPLIASSVMSKKLASGAETIVLDVKYGSGAFMKTPEDACRLAQAMVNIGKANGRKTAALVTSMEFPLGDAVGNSLAIQEAVAVLRGEKRGELYDVSLTLAAAMFSLSYGISEDEARKQVEATLHSGAAYEKFIQWIEAQGGDSRVIENNTFPVAKHTRIVRAEADGYVCRMNAEEIGNAACLLGSGRRTKEDIPDLAAGITLSVRHTDFVRAGDPLATLYTNTPAELDEAENLLRGAIRFSHEKPEAIPAVYQIIR